MERWRGFFGGNSHDAMEELVMALIENAGARRAGRDIQKSLNSLKLFWRHESSVLSRARSQMKYDTYPVPQKERDFLFLKRRYEAPVLLVQSK